jgi:ribosome maturation factor RimP
MESQLTQFKGKKIDVNCGSGCVFQGTVLEVGGGVLTLESDEEKAKLHIALDKIVAVLESTDHSSRPGFIV